MDTGNNTTIIASVFKICKIQHINIQDAYVLGFNITNWNNTNRGQDQHEKNDTDKIQEKDKNF